MSVKFVRLTRDGVHTYDSYTDYWSLVRLSGFEVCEENEVEPDSDHVYILSPPNGNAHAIAGQARRCRMICWFLERPVSGLHTVVNHDYDAVWVSDRWLADELRHEGKVRYVPVGGHPQLGGEPVADKRWDVTHQAYVYGRRASIINDLIIAGFRVGPACWGKDRDEQLAASKVGLCLHQDNLLLLEPLRYVLFACWKLPIVAEKCHRHYPYHVYPLDEICRATDWQTNYDLMTRHLTFRSCVEAAL